MHRYYLQHIAICQINCRPHFYRIFGILTKKLKLLPVVELFLLQMVRLDGRPLQQRTVNTMCEPEHATRNNGVFSEAPLQRVDAHCRERRRSWPVFNEELPQRDPSACSRHRW